MAYVDPSQDPSQNPDENASQAAIAAGASAPPQQATAAGGAPSASTPPATSSGGGSGVVTGGGVGGAEAGASASSSQAKPSTSGSWTNLNSYLSANADQGAQVAGQIEGAVNSQGQNAQSEVNSVNTGFNQAVSSGATAEDSAAVNKAIQDASQLQAGQSLSAADLAAFGSQASATYGGPTDMTAQAGYSQAAADAAAAANTAQEAQTEYGRDVLLQNQYNNTSPTGYNPGEQNLDQLLLEGSDGAKAIINSANQWGNLSTALGSDVSNGNAAAQTAQAQAAQDSTDALSAFNTGRTAANTSVSDYLANQKANYSTDYNALVSALNGYSGGNLSLTAAQAQALGLTQGEKLYNLNQASPTLGSQYLSQAAFNPNAEITANQAAELSALDQLGAAGNQTATDKYAGDTLAGTQTADNSINAANFQQALANADTVWNNYANSTPVAGNAGYYSIGGGPDDLYMPGSASDTNSSIQNALNGVGPTASIGGLGAQIGGEQQALQSQAATNYWNDLNSLLQQGGYNNQVSIA